MGAGALLRRGRLGCETSGIDRRDHHGEGDSGVAIVEHCPMRRVQVRPLLNAAWAKRGHLTVHDALYPALAEHLGATLVTTDLRLSRSPQLGVPVITA